MESGRLISRTIAVGSCAGFQPILTIVTLIETPAHRPKMAATLARRSEASKTIRSLGTIMAVETIAISPGRKTGRNHCLAGSGYEYKIQT
jgi:hypothetical protein